MAINAEGAKQMIYLKNLMLSRSYFDRVPDQSLIAGKNGEKYERVVATRGKDYLMAYTYTGKAFSINTGKIQGNKLKVSWYNPRSGSTEPTYSIDNAVGMIHVFNRQMEKKKVMIGF